MKTILGARLKVGDKVRVANENQSFGWNDEMIDMIGNEYIVKDITRENSERQGVVLETPHHQSWTFDNRTLEKFVSDEEYELYKNEEKRVEEMKTVELGDIVMLADLEPESERLKHGKEYEVAHVSDNGEYVKIPSGDGSRLWEMYSKRFKIVKRYKDLTKEEKAERMRENLKELLKIDNSSEINDLKRSIERGERDIVEYMDTLASINRALRKNKAKLIALQNIPSEVDESKMKDIESLFEHPTVEDIKVIGKKVEIITDYIDIFDERGNRFKGNKYRVVFDYQSNDVRFFGLDDEYSRVSYWCNDRGNKDYLDPHPHVNGISGRACLGDAGSMLATTLNDRELYASYIIALNFLQQVNIHDGAGAYIRNWDCIDADGNIIENPFAPKGRCTYCDEELYDEDDIYICDECGGIFCHDHVYGTPDGHVCSNCANEHNYTWCYDCNDLHKQEDMTEVTGHYYCNGCLEDNFTKCDKCGDYVENTVECERCGKVICETCNYSLDGNDYCENCYDIEIEEQEERDEEIEEELDEE